MINAERVIELRKQYGWGQRQLAKEAGISHTVISKIESKAQEDIKLSVIVAIANALNVTVDSLLDKNATQALEIDLIPELNSLIHQLRKSSPAVQKQVSGMVRGFLASLE
jgi:transcriptional regulator with XRE-family HTH domain